LDLSIRLPGLRQPAIRDLSASGVCCTTDSSIPLLSHVHLVLVLPTSRGLREVPCDGAVVRSAKEDGQHGASYETAIFFTEIRETDRAAITEYVSTLRSHGAVA
jgi:hypothetical protein